MNDIKFLKTGFIIMMVLNIALIAMLFVRSGPPHHRGHLDGMQRAVKLLHLDENQKSEFELLARGHHKQMKEIDSLEGKLITAYFHPLMQEDPPAPDKAIDEHIAALESEKLSYTYQHLYDVKKILQPEQHQYFGEFIERLQFVINERDQRPRPKKK